MLQTVYLVQCQWQSMLQCCKEYSCQIGFIQMHLHRSNIIANSLSSHVHSSALPQLHLGLHSRSLSPLLVPHRLISLTGDLHMLFACM